MSLGPSLAFFSYSRRDSDFVLKLAKDLRAAGADLWLDQLDIRAGQHWDTVIAEALGRSTRLLVVLTPDSVASDNVMDEVSFALDKQKTVIPVLHRPCDLPFRLRRMQYADFTTSYEKGLAALLRALDVEPAAAPVTDNRAGTATQPVREPVIVSPPVSPPQQPRQGLSRGMLIGIAVGILVLGMILWKAIPSSKPQNDVTKDQTSVKQDDISKPDTASKSDEKSSIPETSQVAPPGTQWVSSFLAAEQGPSVDALRPFFEDVMSPYYGNASWNWSQVAQDKRNYFARFPTITYTLAGEPTYYSASPTSGKIEFVADYAETRSDGQEFTGRTQMSLSVHYVDGAWKIAGMTERKVH